MRELATSTVLYVCHTAAVSGAEMSLLHLMKGLDPERYRPLAVVPEPGRFTELLASHGIPFRVVPMKMPSKVRPDRLLYNLRGLTRAMQRHETALVHANSFHALRLAYALKARSAPMIVSVRDIIPFTRLTRRMILSADRVVCVSKATARHLLGGSERANVGVIYNGVDPDEFAADSATEPARVELGLGDLPRPLVGMIAPLVPWKGHTLLLDAARRASAASGKGGYLLVGDASYFSGQEFVRELEALAAAPELAGRVVMPGFREDVARVLASLDIVVCPSLEPDPFPRAMLEAMAAGRAVVASDGGGIPEAIEDGVSGLLFPPGDAEALARALLTLFDDPGLVRRLGQAARRRVVERFGIARHCAAFQDLYDAVRRPRTSP